LNQREKVSAANNKGIRNRATSTPILKEDVNPFRFNVHWFEKKGCWGIKAGYGERCHSGHGILPEASAQVSKKSDCTESVSFFDQYNPIFQEICTMSQWGNDYRYRRMLEKGMTDLCGLVIRKYSENNELVNSPVTLTDKETNIVSLLEGSPPSGNLKRKRRQLEFESL
jgi:hypothetical protein